MIMEFNLKTDFFLSTVRLIIISPYVSAIM